VGVSGASSLRSYWSNVTLRDGGDRRSGDGERACAYWVGGGEMDSDKGRWGSRGAGASSSDSSGVNCTRRRAGALTLGGGEMVDRGAAVCSDFFWMMPARAAAGLWRGGLSGVGGCWSSSESEAAGIGGRAGSAGEAIAGAAGAAPPFMSSM
jgi:hypothetical protein